MNEEEFEKKWREREREEAEYRRHQQKEHNALFWLLLALPVICILNVQIGAVCIAGTIVYYVIKAIAGKGK